MRKHQHHSSSEDEDILIPVIPMEDPLVHTSMHPFCDDTTCPCHEDHDSITRVHAQYQEGLITAREATNIVNGKTV